MAAIHRFLDAEQPPRRHAKTFHGGVTQRPSMGSGYAKAWADQAKPWPGPADGGAEPPVAGQPTTHPRHGCGMEIRRNQIKASLRAFQRWYVKVLGFGVKARLRPQRMASRGCSDPFALVGAIGEACGEAWGVFFWGSPPGCWCVLPLLLLVCWPGWCVGVVRVLVAFMC